jgi:hypothetical protein
MYCGYVHPLSFIRELIMRMNKLLISVLAIGLLIGVSTDSRAHLNVVGDTGEDYGGLLVAYGFAENEIPTLDADIGDWEATITDPVFWITTEAMTSNDFWGTGATYNLGISSIWLDISSLSSYIYSKKREIRHEPNHHF